MDVKDKVWILDQPIPETQEKANVGDVNCGRCVKLQIVSNVLMH